MRRLVSVFLLTFVICFSAYPIAGKYEFIFPSVKELQVGEELTYVVRYSFIKLGEVKLKIKEKKEIKGKYYYSAIAYIDSYEGVPLVNLHQIYESRFGSDYFSRYFRGIVKYDDYSSYTIYNFNYPEEIQVKKGKVFPAEVWTDSTSAADTIYQDGLSIFYYARMNLGTDKTEYLPCFVNEAKVYTKINFSTERQGVSIDALDYKIECLKLDGETDFVSVFGLTGFFEGWFSNDAASVPVLAHMKVLIGNITLELKSWKREGWIPPKYVN